MAEQRLASRMEFSNVTAVAKANVYFDGGVVSHTLLFADGSRKTLGLVFPGTYHFDTQSAERMEITDGCCRIRLDGEDNEQTVRAGEEFSVAANSGFSISVSDSPCQYVCSFLD